MGAGACSPAAGQRAKPWAGCRLRLGHTECPFSPAPRTAASFCILRARARRLPPPTPRPAPALRTQGCPPGGPLSTPGQAPGKHRAVFPLTNSVLLTPGRRGEAPAGVTLTVATLLFQPVFPDFPPPPLHVTGGTKPAVLEARFLYELKKIASRQITGTPHAPVLTPAESVLTGPR